jgi:hypothetical protein
MMMMMMMLNTNTYKLLVWRPKEKRPLRRSTSRRVDNIKKAFRKLDWGDME